MFFSSRILPVSQRFNRNLADGLPSSASGLIHFSFRQGTTLILRFRSDYMAYSKCVQTL